MKKADIIEEFREGDRVCRIVRNPMGGLNGYVQVPINLRGLDYEKIGVTVHGGLTYGTDAEGFVGFDTLHAGDWWPEEELSKNVHASRLDILTNERGRPYARMWTRDRVREETIQLAHALDQLDGC